MKRLLFAIGLLLFLVVLNIVVRAEEGEQEFAPVPLRSGVYETPYRYGYYGDQREPIPLMRVWIDLERQEVGNLWDMNNNNDLSDDKLFVTSFIFFKGHNVIWILDGVIFIFGFIPKDDIYRLTLMNRGDTPIYVDFEYHEKDNQL